MKWWQDPEQHVEVIPGDTIQKGDVWVYGENDIVPAKYTIGGILDKDQTPLYRRIYPEVVALRMQVQDLTEENDELKKQLEIYKELINIYLDLILMQEK
jgi:hypothetical protein